MQALATPDHSPMLTSAITTLLFQLVAAFQLAGPFTAAQPPLRYSVDLNDRAQHEFRVTLRVDSLLPGSELFQFAATAPGTYEVMDIGRFVRRFQAFDAAGNEIPTDHVTTNQWRFADPRRVREVRYSIAETMGTAVSRDPIYPMCGSALRDDHALINGQAVFGFPGGMQSAASSVAISRPTGWIVGTSLRANGDGWEADDYDQLVDSPILAGELTTATLDVTGVPVEVYAYSPSHVITAAELLDAMHSMLLAAGGFLGKLPVDRYTFLYDFLKPPERITGAWEHSYGSEYAVNEAQYTPQFGKFVTDMAAHEFFHVVTPLNLHSEIIEHFNFETPVPSRHLWLYEGATEWAAQKMQLEAHLKTAPEYLATVVQKARSDRLGFDTTWSLAKIAMTSYSDSGQRQYPNVYQRGALVAGLLDIRLLELSGGAHGLRDLIADLGRVYGKKRAFPDDSLFDIIVARTSPALRDFFSRYVSGAEHLPLGEYYAKLGIRLIGDGNGMPARFEIDPNPNPAQLRLRTAWLSGSLPPNREPPHDLQ
jgi:predicted metalloprotease with PDZ domain